MSIVIATEDGMPVKYSNPFPTSLTGSNVKQLQVGTDQDFVFANSAAENTNATAVDIVKPTTSPDYEYEIIVYNPSTVSDLTIKVLQKELALKGSTRYALVATLNIPKSQTISGTTVNTYARFVQKIFNGGDLQLIASNDTVLGGSDGFTATLRLREVG